MSKNGQKCAYGSREWDDMHGAGDTKRPAPESAGLLRVCGVEPYSIAIWREAGI